MATFYASDIDGVAWSETKPVFRPLGSGLLAVAMGTHTFATNPAQNDVIRFCKVPRNVAVIGGWIAGADLDTGTEALDIDFGWEANGAESASTAGFGNMGVLDGDAVSQIIPVAGIWRPLQGVLFTQGFQAFSQETWLSGLVNAAANAGGTGKLSMMALYRAL